MIYWDTSCVLKLYARESDSAHWERLVASSREDFASSALLRTELACALRQKEAELLVRPGGASRLLAAFDEHVAAGRFMLAPVGSDVLDVSVRLVAFCRQRADPIRLRALDALHLATAQVLRCTGIATADVRMRAAADALALPVV